MAGEFVIEALEPRQLLSSSLAATAPTAATPTAAMTVATCTATSSAVSAATSSTSTTTTTDATKDPAFVRPGSTDTTASTSSGSTSGPGSPIPWGTDIYPPPVFNGSGGHGTPRTTVLVGPAAPTSNTGSGSSSTPTSIVPPRTIITGRRLGRTGAAKHFSVRPDDEVVHSGRPSAAVIGPQIVSPPSSHLSPFAATTFAQVVRPGVIQATSAIGIFSTDESEIHGLSLANWTATASPVASAPIGNTRSLPASTIIDHTFTSAMPDSTPPPSSESRIMRPIAANGLAGLLLPLATMDMAVLPTDGKGVSKWEMDVALGSLSVLVAGYWYLCDAAARRRRQRAMAVSLFCDKPIE